MKKQIALLLLLLSAVSGFSQTLHINVNGIRSSSGNIRLAFYSNSESFDAEKPMFIRTVAKKDIINSSMKVIYTDLKPGLYGIAILDDENENKKMDYGLILPKEGFGFSDYYHTGMSRPKFHQFDFVLGAEPKKVEIKVRYL